MGCIQLEDLRVYRDIIERLPEGVFVVDANGLVLFVNSAGSGIMGMSKEEMLNRPFGLSLVKGSAPELPVTRPDGKSGTAEIKTVDIEWNGERATLVFLADVTDRKIAEDAMRRSEEAFRLAFEKSKDPIFWADVKTGMLVNCNEAAERLVEAHAEDIIGRHHTTLHPPELADHYLSLFRSMTSAERVFEDEGVVLNKKGKRIPVTISGSVMNIGGRDVIQSIFRDMTAHKVSEEKIAFSEDRYRLLAENVMDLIWTSDMNLRFTYMSPSSETILGFKFNESGAIDIKDVLTPESFAMALNLLSSALEADKAGGTPSSASRTLDLQHIRKDGSIIWCEVRARFLRDAGGKITGLIGVTRDITERKKAEAKIKNAYDRLKDTQEGLIQSEKLAAIGRFSSGIAHEVKNPLGLIVSATEFLEAKIKDPDADTADALNKIKESALRSAFVLQSFLEYARPSKQHIEKLDLAGLAREAADSLMIKPLITNIKVVIEAKDRDVRVRADRNHMIQVIFNLIKNSIESMSDAGLVTVRVYKETGRSPLPGGASAAVAEVVDNGRGITEDGLKKMFEPFYTTKEADKGTGLGLFVVKTIIENHGGCLAVDSVVGRGTTVKIVLPLAYGD